MNDTNKLLSEQPIKPIVVAGMGPGGLAVAIEIAKKGLPVIIVEPRDNFSRIQRLHFNSQSFQFFESLRDPSDPLDTKFFDHQCFREVNPKTDLPYSEGTVEVKDVQAFLARKLKAFPNVEIRQGAGHKIKEVKATSQELTFEGPGGVEDSIQFSHLFAADGARRGVLDVVNASDPESKITHSPLALQPRQAQVGTVTLQTKEGVVLSAPPAEINQGKFKAEHMTTLLSLGWDKPYFPKAYVFHNQKNNKFFVSGEVPKSIERIQDATQRRLAMENWGKFILYVKMDYDPNDLGVRLKSNPDNEKHIDEKNSLLVTAFQLKLMNADKPAIQLGQGGCFALIGDAFKNANFYFAHGMNDAISDGRKAASAINTDDLSFNLAEFKEHQERQLKALNRNMGYETSIQTQSMNEIVSDFETHIPELLKIAKKMNDPNVKNALEALSSNTDYRSSGFDIHLFQLQIQDLSKFMDFYIQNKLTSGVEKKKGLFYTKGERNKYLQISAHLNSVMKAIEKPMTKFLDTNNIDSEMLKKWQKEKKRGAGLEK